MAYYRPKTATELAELRVQLIDETALWETITLLASVDPGYVNPIEAWTSLRQARLWWIGADCCELLAQAAREMPPVTLTPEMVPDVHGFVFFERPITGHDAAVGLDIRIDAIQWHPDFVNGLPALAITTWQHRGDGLPPTPMGRSNWHYGFDTDHEMPDVSMQRMASIIEDRQLVAALWQLTSQPELVASAEEKPYRAAAKRMVRKGYKPQPVRLIYLHRKTGRRNEPASAGTREYSHRWVVKAHWRQQPYGPGRSFRRAQYIAPHVKGPEGKPLRVRDSVKVWKNRP